MPEEPDQPAAPDPGPVAPQGLSRAQKIGRWLISTVVIFAVSAVTEKLLDLFSAESRESLREANKHFVASVEHTDPFNLARLFYSQIFYPHPGGAQFFSGKVFDAAIYSAKHVWAGGAPAILTAVLALVVGVAVLAKSKSVNLPFGILLTPVVGGCFVWLVLKAMWLAGLLFGWLLAAAGMIAYASVTIPVVGYGISAVVKEREHHFTNKIVKSLTSK
jgi:hypothetical protein